MYYYITKPENIILSGDVLALDIETDGLNPRHNSVLLIQLSDGDRTYVLDARILPKKYILSILEQYKNCKFIAHNAKFDISMIYGNFGYLLENVFDTMLAEAVLYPGQGKLLKSLKDVVSERFNIELDKTLQSSFLTPTREFTQEQLEYAAEDVYFLKRIYEEQIEEINTGGFSTVMKLENALVPVITKMEYTGVCLSTDKLLPVVEEQEVRMKEYEAKLYEIANETFNPRSTQQLKAVLHRLAIRDRKPDLKVDSTAYDVIKKIRHPFITNLLSFRKSSKIVSTYGLKLIEKIEEDGKIHANFNQIGAATGRLSSSSPNLQNIPASKEFRSPFVASPGYKFLTADYSQIELRIAGIVSGEEEIINEYTKETADLHRLTASKIFNVPVEEVTSSQRSHGKTGNFSTLYGSSPNGLATKQDIPIALAEKIINGFWNGYPTLRHFKDKIGSEALHNGWVRTPLGRIRYLHKPDSRDPAYSYKIGAMKREGFNMIIQGFAADIMKYSMVLVDKALGDAGRLVLTVHDEVGVELKEETAEEATKLVLDTMEKAGTILVKGTLPMKVEGKLADCWTK